MSRRLAVVSGGTRGIGAAIVQRLAASNRVAVICRPGTETPAECIRAVADLSKQQDVDVLAQALSSREIDILVNCAGVNLSAPFDEITASDFDRVMQVNVRAPMRLCQAVIPGMCARKWGRIVNVASIFSIIGRARKTAYTCSKFAIDGLTTALSAEVAADGVIVNCVSPGLIDTDMTRQMLDSNGIRDFEAMIPARRMGLPHEVAALVAWLVSDENTYVTGQNIAIDGGFSRV